MKMPIFSCFTCLTQSKQRKQHTLRYCKKHKLHYFQECAYCYLERENTATLVVENENH